MGWEHLDSHCFKKLYSAFRNTTLHTTAGLLLKLSRVGPGQSLDGRPDAAGSGVATYSWMNNEVSSGPTLPTLSTCPLLSG